MKLEELGVCSYSPEKQTCRVRGRGGLRSEPEARFASRFVLQGSGLSPPSRYAPRLALATQPFPSHPLAIVCLFLSVSSVRLFYFDIHISGQNIKP
jgi:hypothetical protein